MGSPSASTSAPIAGRARSEALARAYARHDKGELVHIEDVKGDVRVQRAGAFEWEHVPEGGMTVHVGAKVKTADKGSASVRSRSYVKPTKVKPGSLMETRQFNPEEKPSSDKLTWAEIQHGAVRARSYAVPPPGARPR